MKQNFRYDFQKGKGVIGCLPVHSPAFLAEAENTQHSQPLTVRRGLKVQTAQWRREVQARTGTQPATPGNARDSGRKGKVLNVMLHSWHGVEWEEGEVTRTGWVGGGFVWRQEDFQRHGQTTKQKHLRNIDTTQVVHKSFWWLPSSRIRWDICPPPPLPGSGTAADSQIKIARGTIQTLLPFCRECLLTAPVLKRLERG